MKKNEENYENKICINCDHCVYIGEGDYICNVDEPILVMEEFCPNDDYWCCGGADFENDEE